ncbi:uroporphyrinogen-III C-methyltransferase [Sphaerotilus microaerophilus]|uniref:uroporphyrinogen-III C-methyltransferase n=2 Tax=Sphaerotilus microaerophilus TaxID=2914710 RepID=A0ABN6PVL4_9BURK|nr:uroporphyrinogen-III C-methyltransferase [Sphaerotilus sp. FB-5]
MAMNMLDDRSRLRPAADAAPQAPGFVSLIGAGPGDPELLTLKAARLLGNARLLLYDHLVSREVLRLVPDDADLIYVGKEAGQHTLGQEAIVELMLRLARSGRSLVRLKGGDPYIFGRGGEEALALAAAGIPFEVVPGISAAQGAAAAAGIPLTHRDHATAVTYVTGHGRADRCHTTAPGDDPDAPDVDWAALARPHQTLVIYMGLGRLPQISAQLIAHGMPMDTPAALVERASLPDQRCVVGCLRDLPALAVAEGIKAPALILVGTVVGLQAQLNPARMAALCGTATRGAAMALTELRSR